jgi:hypothetical protein
MGSSTTRLTPEQFEALLRRALWDKNEAWRKEYRAGKGEVYEVQPWPGLAASDDEEHFDTDEESPWYEAGTLKSFTTSDGYTLEGVDEGGGMDQGSNAYVVVKLTHPDGTIQHFRKDGYYASHYGYDWDGDLYEVKPTERVVTFYEEKV